VLAEADLDGAYLGEAELDGADFRGANLRTATGLTACQLRRTRLDERTQLPPSLASEFAAVRRT
jgi:uncharacterized protein YjbI with pentapeptide repeats